MNQLPVRSAPLTSNYYQYKFVSPEFLYARIKEEMRAFFATGAVDDLMFPIYLKDCLRKMGRGSYSILQTLLFIDCFQATLPPDFYDAREVWATWDMIGSPVRTPGSYYQQITTVLNKPFDACNPVTNCDPCNPDIMTVVVKTNEYRQQSVRLKHLLTPGNIHTKSMCSHGSLNASVFNTDKFDISEDKKKITTEFREGDIYLVYYALEEDCSGNQLIPENYRIEQFIVDEIKAKMYEFLWSTESGDTYNQSLQRYQLYRQKADESYVLADIEIKKQTVYQKAYGIFRDTHRNNVYERMMHGRYYNGFPHRRRGF